MCVHVACLVALAFPFDLSGAARERTADDFAGVAQRLAPQIREVAVAKLGGRPFRVAVFPFGDSEGAVAPHEPGAALQGELIVGLVQAAQGKYLVLDKPGLKKALQAAGVNPSGAAAGDPAGTAAVLKKLGVDVAVVGSIDAKSAAQVARDRLPKVDVVLTVVFQDGTARQFTAAVLPQAVAPPRTTPSGRFKVQLFLTGGGGEVEIPLVTSRRQGSEFRGVFFAEVQDGLALGTAAAGYTVRISNKGTPAARPEHPRDGERLYGAAVLIDGVNSIHQERGDGSVGPAAVLPRHARKWVLTGPGQQLVPDPTREGGYRLDRVSDRGHSVIDIRGFQRDNRTAEKFLFAAPRESAAAALGVANDLGVIAVHFYPEEMGGANDASNGGNLHSGATRANAGGNAAFAGGAVHGNTDPDLGTKAGPRLGNRVGVVDPKLTPNPVEVWRIFYRKKGECPIKPEERIPAAE